MIWDPEVVPMNGCWLWTAATNGVGYGKKWDGEKLQYAHRMMYEALVGPIPEGMELDHLCRRTLCVNPAHLEPVVQKTNLLRGVSPAAKNSRKTECLKGHAFTDKNTRITVVGGRACRKCDSIRSLAYYRRKQAQA